MCVGVRLRACVFACVCVCVRVRHMTGTDYRWGAFLCTHNKPALLST